MKNEAIQALTALGYSSSEALKALQNVEITDGMDVETVLKHGLKRLAVSYKRSFYMEKRVISTQLQDEDIKIETNLRPQTLDEYIGQKKTKEKLKVYIEAAKQREEPLDHVLFYGPPGLGKTTLAGIIANEMGTHIKITSGPAIGKPGEMAAILSNLQEGDVLFVDEIHRLNRQVEEVLYPAMEDYVIDIMIGKGRNRAFNPSGSAEVYAGGRNDQGRTFIRTFKGSFRRGTSSGIL